MRCAPGEPLAQLPAAMSSTGCGPRPRRGRRLTGEQDRAQPGVAADERERADRGVDAREPHAAQRWCAA